MRATVMRDGKLMLAELPDLSPGPGQVLVETIACGICGSDLHALKFPNRMREAAIEGGAPEMFRLDKDMVMGHEFSARVIALGDGVTNLAPGDVVVSMPVMITPQGMDAIGYSNTYPGGYAEKMLLSAFLCMKVPDGLDPRHAALTEPMAVGLHAVEKSGIKQGETALVLGAGPVGLAVIAALRLAGIEPIVAADFSPKRRALALTMGAHEAVDPKAEAGIAAWTRLDGAKPLHIFEAVGVQGMIEQAMKDAPRSARITVVGVCMEPDTIRPMMGINKELSIQFVLGYTPEEFGRTLQSIAGGDIDVAPLITGEVGIAGVAGAFESLANPEAHAKILVEPSLG
jgi:threonine dehydrogenase-like Zn-dependent dehydrogenase